ncbi:MAG: hypothetical protein EOP45_11635 [Sphingobacteriaceae bacterium]|nr:MAG: hypothetical protein EOP45_11635 [Sphingobacteriaceae bacterium]
MKLGEPWITSIVDDLQLDDSGRSNHSPKIEIAIVDTLQRKHQCATIQLDFQLSERFDLTYIR